MAYPRAQRSSEQKRITIKKLLFSMTNLTKANKKKPTTTTTTITKHLRDWSEISRGEGGGNRGRVTTF